MTSLKGPEGFEQFYSEMYGERWPALKTSLLGAKKHVAVLNPHSEFSFSDQLHSIPGISYIHQVGENFPPPTPGAVGPFNYYLLDAASILAVEALDPRPGEKVVDLCAAPGGKSLLCAWKMENQGLLVSNDRSAARRARIYKIFNEYLPLSKQSNHKVTGHDASKWCLYEKNIYDKVLLDAPCSSERHVLEDPKELAQWAPGRSKAIAVSQFAMLASALDIVKIGGIIVYSTCALSRLENDEIIQKLHQKRGGRFEIIRQEFSFGSATEYGWQVLPDATGWGPFYLAIIKKIKNSAP